MADEQVVDTVLDAHLRRQANWEKDAEEYFPEQTAAEKKRIKLLDDLSAMDAKRDKEMREAARAKEKADAVSRAQQELADAQANHQAATERLDAALANAAAAIEPEPDSEAETKPKASKKK